MESVETPQKPWRQLAFVLGEAALTLLSGGVLFILISRLSGPELLGTYALAFAWLTLFQGVSSFGIPEFIIREVGSYGRDAAGKIVHSILLGLGSGVAALGLMWAAVRLLGYSTYVVDVVTIAGLALFPAFLNTACRSVFLALRQMHFTFLAVLVEVTIVMSASLYLLLSGFGAIALMITLVVAKVASAALSLTLLRRVLSSTRPAFDFGFLKQVAQMVVAWGVGNMLAMLAMRINMIMVSVWVDLAAVGHFAAATKIMEIGLIIPSLFVQFLMSRVAHGFNTQGERDPNRFGAWYQLLFALVVPMCVGVWVFAGPILTILFGQGFSEASWVLRILMIFLIVETADAAMSAILKAMQRQRQDVVCLAFNPLANILLNLALLPVLGMIGAAIGRLGGAGASATLRHLLITRQLTGVNWFRFAMKPALISIAVGAVCYVLLDSGRSVWLLLPLYVGATAVLLKVASGFSLSAIKDMMSPRQI